MRLLSPSLRSESSTPPVRSATISRTIFCSSPRRTRSVMCERCTDDYPWLPKRCHLCNGEMKAAGETGFCVRCGETVVRYPYDAKVIEAEEQAKRGLKSVEE